MTLELTALFGQQDEEGDTLYRTFFVSTSAIGKAHGNLGNRLHFEALPRSHTGPLILFTRCRLYL